WRGSAITAARAAHSRISCHEQRSPRYEIANFQLRLRPFRRWHRRDGNRKPHQQAQEKASRAARLRSNRFSAVPRLPAELPIAQRGSARRGAAEADGRSPPARRKLLVISSKKSKEI